MFFSRKYKEALLRTLRVAVRLHRKVEEINFRSITIKEQLVKIMGTQAELDEKVAVIGVKLDTISTNLGAVPGAIQSESQQIKDFIAANQNAGLDLSGLSGIATRLDAVADNTGSLVGEINTVFEPPAAPAPSPAPEPVPSPVPEPTPPPPSTDGGETPA
jgi:hypothetical protein